MKRSILFLAFLAVASSASAQFSPGIEAQLYPAGQIVVASFEVPMPFLTEYRVHAGYNRTRRHDWGEHDDERGSGFGIGADVTRVFSGGGSGLITSVRLDIWKLDIDWTDEELVQNTIGTSSVTVVQPTVRTGYRFEGPLLSLDALVGLGTEMNVSTQGDNVGQGLILLGGLRVTM